MNMIGVRFDISKQQQRVVQVVVQLSSSTFRKSTGFFLLDYENIEFDSARVLIT